MEDLYAYYDLFEQCLLTVLSLSFAGRHSEAIEMLSDLAEKHPESAWLRRSVLAQQALIEVDRGDTDAALRRSREAQRINLAIEDYHEFVANQLGIAQALRRAGRNEEALEELERGMNTAMEKGDSVRTHTRKLLAKLHVHSSLEAVALARRASRTSGKIDS